MKKPLFALPNGWATSPWGSCTSCPDVNLKVESTTHRPIREEYQTALEAAFERHFKQVQMSEDASQAADAES